MSALRISLYVNIVRCSRDKVMNGLNLLKKLTSKNKSLLRQIRPLHVSSAQALKSVAPRESLNAEYVLHYLIYVYKIYLIVV